MVDGNIEKPLDSRGMKIHGENAIGAGGGQQIGDQLGRDWLTTGRLLLLLGVGEIGDHRGDASGGCASQRIDDQEKFHEVMVYRIAHRLDGKDVRSTDVLLEFDSGLAVTPQPDDGTAEGSLELSHYLFGELWVGRS